MSSCNCKPGKTLNDITAEVVKSSYNTHGECILTPDNEAYILSKVSCVRILIMNDCCCEILKSCCNLKNMFFEVGILVFQKLYYGRCK
jgi:hypothetical protein